MPVDRVKTRKAVSAGKLKVLGCRRNGFEEKSLYPNYIGIIIIFLGMQIPFSIFFQESLHSGRDRI